jgi:hypothetical protein
LTTAGQTVTHPVRIIRPAESRIVADEPEDSDTIIIVFDSDTKQIVEYPPTDGHRSDKQLVLVRAGQTVKRDSNPEITQRKSTIKKNQTDINLVKKQKPNRHKKKRHSNHYEGRKMENSYPSTSNNLRSMLNTYTLY